VIILKQVCVMPPEWTWTQDRQWGAGKVLNSLTHEYERFWTIEVRKADPRVTPLGLVCVRVLPDGEMKCSILHAEAE
jgi:hypothetical protein